MKGNFSYDKKGLYYSTTTIYGFIKNKDCKISNETLMAILNSQLCWWFLVNTGTVLANGYYRYKPTYLKPFPIPNIPENLDSLIQGKVKNRIKNSLDQNIIIEKEIDQIIYRLYELSDDEIKIIESV